MGNIPIYIKHLDSIPIRVIRMELYRKELIEKHGGFALEKQLKN
jgi:hypothetical protein